MWWVGAQTKLQAGVGWFGCWLGWCCHCAIFGCARNNVLLQHCLSEKAVLVWIVLHKTHEIRKCLEMLSVILVMSYIWFRPTREIKEYMLFTSHTKYYWNCRHLWKQELKMTALCRWISRSSPPNDSAPCLHTQKPELTILKNPVSVWFGAIIKNIFHHGWQSIKVKGIFDSTQAQSCASQCYMV